MRYLTIKYYTFYYNLPDFVIFHILVCLSTYLWEKYLRVSRNDIHIYIMLYRMGLIDLLLSSNGFSEINKSGHDELKSFMFWATSWPFDTLDSGWKSVISLHSDCVEASVQHSRGQQKFAGGSNLLSRSIYWNSNLDVHNLQWTIFSRIEIGGRLKLLR